MGFVGLPRGIGVMVRLFSRVVRLSYSASVCLAKTQPNSGTLNKCALVCLGVLNLHVGIWLGVSP